MDEEESKELFIALGEFKAIQESMFEELIGIHNTLSGVVMLLESIKNLVEDEIKKA